MNYDKLEGDWFTCEACECNMYHIIEYDDHYHCSCASCGVVKTIHKQNSKPQVETGKSRSVLVE